MDDNDILPINKQRTAKENFIRHLIAFIIIILSIILIIYFIIINIVDISSTKNNQEIKITDSFILEKNFTLTSTKYNEIKEISIRKVETKFSKIFSLINLNDLLNTNLVCENNMALNEFEFIRNEENFPMVFYAYKCVKFEYENNYKLLECKTKKTKTFIRKNDLENFSDIEVNFELNKENEIKSVITSLQIKEVPTNNDIYFSFYYEFNYCEYGDL